jgi:type I restriction enzyme M protein
VGEAEIDLQATQAELETLARQIDAAREKHNQFLRELGLPEIR